MNDPKGSQWHKWDLHVHTPESLVHNYNGANPWDRFLDELESLPSEFKVIGINDYIFLDGYRRILEEVSRGRLKNISLFLPVIELRIDKFGGSPGHLRRVNCHILFSDKLGPDVIEQQFLNALSSKYVLTPQYEHIRKSGKWAAIPTRDSLVDLGKLIIDSVPPTERASFGDPLIEGFNNLCISVDSIREVLQSHYFQKNIVTAVGKTEWADIKWGDHSIAEKKTIINEANLVFMSASSVEELVAAKKHLTEAGVNDRLLDCSDAHMFSDSEQKDRLGKCFTWIKADPTFAGLLQVLNEPNERVYLGHMPQDIVHVKNNSTKYISNIKIERKAGDKFSETWFHNDIPLNSGLVAVIGNKGKGKSALTDVIGLLCNAQQTDNFTFLSKDNFRQSKDNKSKHFVATLTWESGDIIIKGLEEEVDALKPELAKYIPQNYLEMICTQLGKIEESQFDHELKKVIFSHINIEHRLGKESLDDLISYMTHDAFAKIALIKVELHSINEEIAITEEHNKQEYKIKLQSLINQKNDELKAHILSKPLEMKKPGSDIEEQHKIDKAAQDIEQLKSEILEIDNNIVDIKTNIAKHLALIAVADRLLARIENMERQIRAFTKESQDELVQIGIALEEIAVVELKRKPIIEKRRLFVEAKAKLEQGLDPANKESLENRKKYAIEKLEALKSALSEPNKVYQAYLAAVIAWEAKKNEIEGNQTETGTLKYYQKQFDDLGMLSATLDRLYSERIDKSKEIHSTILNLVQSYREWYGPVHRYIADKQMVKDNFDLNFDVGIVDVGFESMFFEFISQGIAGSFYGIEEGHKYLGDILHRHDFNTENGVYEFLNEILDCLTHDKRQASNTVRIEDQMRKGKSTTELYDAIFSLDYLKPRYSLRLGEKELHQLSPGERGTLLLLFYLILDKDDIPLIIDQPEENLDNQTVYQLLVPCMKEAKHKRQIIIVTHNPNLAVVCDAEQIIYADLDKMDNYKMQYLPGAIENPQINKAIVDVLEGTMPAFNNRESKYQKDHDAG